MQAGSIYAVRLVEDEMYHFHCSVLASKCVAVLPTFTIVIVVVRLFSAPKWYSIRFGNVANKVRNKVTQSSGEGMAKAVHRRCRVHSKEPETEGVSHRVRLEIVRVICRQGKRETGRVNKRAVVDTDLNKRGGTHLLTWAFVRGIFEDTIWKGLDVLDYLKLRQNLDARYSDGPPTRSRDFWVYK